MARNPALRSRFALASGGFREGRPRGPRCAEGGPGLFEPLWYILLLVATRTLSPALVTAFAALPGLTLLMEVRFAAGKPLFPQAPS
ncbi:MAG: hypothetical protein QXO51_03200 [Halobacteria archaeon]